MTNTTELLPHFHAASQWLAEEHPDAPRPCGKYDFENGKVAVLVEPHNPTYDKDLKWFYAPNLCLTGAVVWAMEVAGWAIRKHPTLFQDLATPQPFEDETWYWGTTENKSGKEDSKEIASTIMLESICTALGREG